MNVGFALRQKLGLLDGEHLNTDPPTHKLRTLFMLSNDHTQRKPDAFDRVAKFLEVLFKSPHLLFGAAIWAYSAYWLLAVSGLA